MIIKYKRNQSNSMTENIYKLYLLNTPEKCSADKFF